MPKVQGYHVGENTPGYMPDSENAHFHSLREAGDYALSLARELREDGYSVTGNKRDGYYGERDAHDLGRSIWIAPCDEPECQDDADLGD